MRLFVKILLSILFVLPILNRANAQQAVATLDSASILMGKQANLSLQLTIPKGSKGLFPMFNDSTFGKLEVVDRSAIDTLSSSGNKITLRQILKLTSWTEGKHLIPQLQFQVKTGGQQQIVNSNELFLSILALKVDTTQAIKDIKAPIETPMTIKEFFMLYWRYILAALLVIILIVAVVIIIRMPKIKKGSFIPRKAPDPAYMVALRALEALKEKKLWQQDLVKLYYIELTEIIRLYIENRFFVPALEQTSSEIIASFKNTNQLDGELLKQLSEMLVQADLVKFAKSTPLAHENEKALSVAFDFVEATKPQAEVKEEKQAEANQPVTSGN
jgi:hypothetical protein